MLVTLLDYIHDVLCIYGLAGLRQARTPNKEDLTMFNTLLLYRLVYVNATRHRTFANMALKQTSVVRNRFVRQPEINCTRSL